MNPTKRILIPMFFACLVCVLFPLGCRFFGDYEGETSTQTAQIVVQGQVDLDETTSSSMLASVKNPGSWTAYLLSDNVSIADPSAISSTGAFSFTVFRTFISKPKVEVRRNDSPNVRVISYLQDLSADTTPVLSSVVVNERSTVIGFIFEQVLKEQTTAVYNDVLSLANQLSTKITELENVLKQQLTNYASVTTDLGTVLAGKDEFKQVEEFVVSTSGTTDPAAASKTISLSASELAFGEVLSGNSSSKELVISNSSHHEKVKIYFVEISGTGSSYYSFTSATTFSTEIATDAKVTLNVVFTPKISGTITGTLKVYHNGKSSPSQVTLSGTGKTQTTDTTTGTSTTTGTATGTTTVTSTGTTTSTGTSTSSSTGTTTTTATSTATTTTTTTTTSTSTTTSTATDTSVTVATKTLSLDPASELAFSSVEIGQTKSLAIKITNTSPVSEIQASAVVSGTGYTLSPSTVPTTTIAAGSNYTFNVVFTPVASGSYTGKVTITHNATHTVSTGISEISLTGTGVGYPTLSVATGSSTIASITFPSTSVNSAATASTFVVSNAGKDNLTFQFAISGASSDFYVVDSNGASQTLSSNLTLGVNTPATYGVVFKPLSYGDKVATLTVSSSNAAGTNSYSVSLTGTGLGAVVALSTNTVALGNVAFGSTGSKTIEIGNTGNTTLTISSVATSTSLLTDLTTPVDIAPGASRTVLVTLNGSTLGDYSGTVTFTTNAYSGTSALTVTGKVLQSGKIFQLSTDTITLRAQAGLSTSTYLYVNNTGAETLSISDIVRSANASFTILPNSATTVAAGASQTFVITFTPGNVIGNSNATITFTNDSATPSVVLSLTGVGLATASYYANLTSNVPSTLAAGNFEVKVASLPVDFTMDETFTFSLPVLDGSTEKTVIYSYVPGSKKFSLDTYGDSGLAFKSGIASLTFNKLVPNGTYIRLYNKETSQYIENVIMGN
ncbi:MAG: choice-of-anchor D domain-containing protein [Candidatus Riflebacteria bacterium]|nr:choice-of-anchor D domain-containing protein [Candidatus Riflebacteria bacterium]